MDEGLEQAAKKIIAETYTKAGGYARLRLLEDVLEGEVYGGHKDDADLAARIRERYPGEADSDAREAVAGWGSAVLGAFSGQQVHERVAEVKKRIENAPELVLYTPVFFGPEQVRALGAWCRANVDPDVFLEMRTDANAAGGCSFVWHDTLHDFSLGARIRAHGQELAARIESYVSSAV